MDDDGHAPMTQYRPSELAQLIITTVEALTPDDRATEGDGFTVRVGFADDDGSQGSRVCWLMLDSSAPTQRRNLTTSRTHDTVATLTTRYPTHAWARAMDDGALIADALRALQLSNDLEVYDTPIPQVLPVGDELLDVVITVGIGYTYSGATQ